VDCKERGTDVRAPISAPVQFTIVILTFARDETLKATLAHLKSKIGDRRDTEIVLVDNNPDTVDRSAFLAGFRHRQVVKTGDNKGVSARNDGIDVARGEIITLLDDDVLVETPDFLDRLSADFARLPEVGLIVGKKLEARTMVLPPECIPHSNKAIDVSKPFLTFRFTGGMVGLRRSMYNDVGGFSVEFFFGQEEYEYSFRIIKRHWKIMFDPEIVAIETNAQGGRMDAFEMETNVLKNRYMIAYLHMPMVQMLANMALFTLYLYMKRRGKLSISRAVRGFLVWRAGPDRAARDPIDRQTQAYIRQCGGATWR
jgi:GT2 family glycosyltransferase